MFGLDEVGERLGVRRSEIFDVVASTSLCPFRIGAELRFAERDVPCARSDVTVAATDGELEE